MKSIIPDNDNPTFVTVKDEYNLFMLAVWSWDDGNNVGSSRTTPRRESIKWKSFDKFVFTLEQDDDDVDDIRQWEFYYCLVQAGPHEEEKKDETDVKQPEQEKTKSKNPLHLPKMFGKDNRIKSMIEDSKNKIVDSTHVVVDTVEHLNPIRMFGHHKRFASQNDALKRSTSDETGMSPEDRQHFVGQKVEEALSRAKNAFAIKQTEKKYDTLDNNTDADEEVSVLTDMSPDVTVSSRKKDVPESPRSDVHAYKDQYGSVMDIVFTNPIAMAKAKAFKAKTPQPERKVLKDIPDALPPPIPEDGVSPQVTRKAFPNFMSDPINKSAVRKKRAVKKSKLQKALAASQNLLRPSFMDDDDVSTLDDQSMHSTKSTKSSTRRKKTRDVKPSKRRSSSVGDIEDRAAVIAKSAAKAAKANSNPTKEGSRRRRSSSVGVIEDPTKPAPKSSKSNSNSKEVKPSRRRSSSVGAIEDRAAVIAKSAAKAAKATATPKEVKPSRRRSSSVGAIEDRAAVIAKSAAKAAKSSANPKEGSRRRRSSSVGAIEDPTKSAADAAAAAKAKAKKDKNRSRSTSKGRRSKLLRKAESARNVTGERRLNVDDDDDDDAISATSNRASSSRSASKTKKSSYRRVPKKRRSELEVGDAASPETKGKSRKKQLKKLEELNRQMKKTMGLDASSADNIVDNSDANSAKSGRSLDERRARKRESQAKLKKTFDKLVVDKAMGGAKGAMDVTKTVGKGAMDVTKGVGKVGKSVTKTVGKGAMDVTKGVGKAMGVTKGTSTTPATAPLEATRTE